MNELTQSIPLERSTLLPTCLVVLACLCFGTIPYFAKSLSDAGMAPYAVAFYRYGLSAIVLLPILLRLPLAQLRTVLWGILSGVSVGLGWVGFVNALETWLCRTGSNKKSRQMPAFSVLKQDSLI